MATPRPTRLLELPTQMLSAAIGKGSRTKKILIFGGLGVGALAVAAYFGLKTVEARSAAALEADFGALGQCLLGEPLAAGETAAGRFRTVQLAALGTPKELRAKAGEQPWPQACSPLAFSVSERVGGSGAQGLGASAAALGKQLKDDATAAGVLELVTKTWADAAAKGVKGAPPGAGPKAPKPLAPLFDLAKTPPMLGAKFSLVGVRSEPAPGAARLRFLVEKGIGDGPALCVMEAKDGSIKCGKLGAKADGAPGLVGTAEDGAKPAVAFASGRNGLFRADAADKLAGGTALGAHAKASGALLALVTGEGDVRLVVAPSGGKPSEKPLLAGTEVDAPALATLFGETVVWQATKPGGGPHLFSRKVGDAGFAPEAAFDVGEVDGAGKDTKEPALDVCRAGDAYVVRLRGTKSDAVATLAGGRWSVPVRTSVLGGALTCRGAEGVTTLVTNAIDGEKNWATIQRTTCTAGGCKTEVVSLKELLSSTPEVVPPDAKGVAAADVAGKVLVVWNGGWLGGVRLRMAPADKLKDAADVVLYDGREEGGTAGLSSYVEAKILPFGDDALLLLSTVTGVRAFRVNKDGAVTVAPASAL